MNYPGLKAVIRGKHRPPDALQRNDHIKLNIARRKASLGPIQIIMRQSLPLCHMTQFISGCTADFSVVEDHIAVSHLVGCEDIRIAVKSCRF